MNTFDAENHHVREILIVAYEQYKRIHVPKHAHLPTAEQSHYQEQISPTEDR